jgi:hypothetical protein
MEKMNLKDEIMALHCIVDSLNEVSYGVLEEGLSPEDISNAMDGLAVLVELKITKLLNAYKTELVLNKYRDYETEIDF